MAGNGVDRRDRTGAMVGIGALLVVVAIMSVGVSDDTGDRIVLPILLAALAVAVGLSRRRLRLLAAAVGAGVPAGLAFGASLRLAMLIAALMGGEVNRTLAGTVGLVLFAAVPGAMLSAVVVLVRRLTGVRPWALAAVLTALGGIALLAPAETRLELAEEGVFAVNIVTFLASFALYGWLVVTLQLRVEQWWDARTARRSAAPGEVATA